MITPIEATIEEFEQGAWVAELVSLDEFDGSFDLRGVTWTGTAVHSKESFGRFYTTVIGGKNQLAKVLRDKWYDGSVSLQAAAQDVCRESGEAFGSATSGKRLTTFERLQGTASQGLDALANVFGFIWWIGRDGAVNVAQQRPSASAPIGLETSATEDSVLLDQPEAALLGASYDEKTVRHIRWTLTEKSFSARLYFLPFLFRNPNRTDYSALCDARVDKQNSDGTVDVIVSGRYGVTKVPLLSGIPGSKIKVNGGEVVTLGYFSGDPQKPFCVAHGQDTAASKNVARVDDEVQVTLSSGDFNTMGANAGGTPVTATSPVVLKGKINIGSSRVKLGD